MIFFSGLKISLTFTSAVTYIHLVKKSHNQTRYLTHVGHLMGILTICVITAGVWMSYGSKRHDYLGTQKMFRYKMGHTNKY